MTGPQPPISKRKTKTSAKVTPSKVKKDTCNTDVVQISPVTPSSARKANDASPNKTTSRGAGARRTLNFSNINLSTIVNSNCRVETIGSLTATAKDKLTQRDIARIEVSLHASPIRLPEQWDNFKFFLLADHTGIASFGAPVELFDVLKQYADTNQHVIPPIKISGTVHAKWSSKTEGELYMTFRQGGAIMEIISASQHLQTFSTFHTIRNIISHNFYSTVSFSRLLGNCVEKQVDRDGNMSFVLQDSTGFAIIKVVRDTEESTFHLDNFRGGGTSCTGRFAFAHVQLDGVNAIGASINLSELSTMCCPSNMEFHSQMVQNTENAHFQFELDQSDYEIHSSN